MGGGKIPIGLIYRKEKPTYGELSGLDGRAPLVDEPIEHIDITKTLNEFLV